MLGDGVIELHNLQTGGDEPKLKGRINQTNLLDMNDHPKETWCRCAFALNPSSCLKETKAFLRAKPNTIQKNIVTLLDLERKEDSIPKPLAKESFVTKSLRVDRKHLP